MLGIRDKILVKENRSTNKMPYNSVMIECGIKAAAVANGKKSASHLSDNSSSSSPPPMMQGPDSIENILLWFQLEKPPEFWVGNFPYTEKKSKIRG